MLLVRVQQRLNTFLRENAKNKYKEHNNAVVWNIHSVGWAKRDMNGRDEEEKGLLWKLPAVKSNQLGKLGPAFGVGAGCGVGFAFGLIGGTGFGPVIPGLQLGFGFGAGCGVGVGFGYGVGRGIAYDENRRYSNVGRVFQNRGIVPVQDEIGALVDELVLNTKKLIQATSREVDKWRRY